MSREFMRRVDGQLRQVIADEVTRLKDPGLGFVTITAVKASPDLRMARVFYTVLGDDEQRAETAAALTRAKARIRGAVGSRVRLKYLPDLEFAYDESIDHGIHMEALLQRLREEDDGLAGDGDGGGG